MTLPVVSTGGRPPILCAKYGVMIVDKVTRATVARLPETGWSLEYDYRIDRTSEATLTVDVGPGGVGDECCSQLGHVGHWMHELVIFRDGNNREVWGGPVTKLRDAPGRGQFTVMAKDRSAWWWRRALAYSLTYSGGARADATRVFMDLLRAAEQTTGTSAWKLPYDPVRLNVSGRETGVIVDGKILTASDIVMIGPEIQTLADSVIDWTVIGRTCYVGSLVIELDPLPILAQDHWLEMDPEIEWDGEPVATQVIMMGARGIMGIWPPGPIVHPRWPQYGSHTARLSDPKITDQSTATEAARSAWELRQQPTLCVLSAGGSLGANAPVIPQDLIPGRVTRVGFDTSCFITSTRLAQTRVNGALQYVAYDSGVPRDLVIPQRITKTTVRVEDSEEVSVLVDLQPVGTDVVRRPGGRSNRQPTSNPGTAEPCCCGVLFWNDQASHGGPTWDFSDVHAGSCSGEYLRLNGVGDFVEWSFSLDSACFNGQPFGIFGQQFASGLGMELALTVNGNTFTLTNDFGSGQPLWVFPLAAETDPAAWNFDYYNSDDLDPIDPWIVGTNVVRLEVVAMNTADYAEIEYLVFGRTGEVDPCLDSDGFPPCLTVPDGCSPIIPAG